MPEQREGVVLPPFPVPSLRRIRRTTEREGYSREINMAVLPRCEMCGALPVRAQQQRVCCTRCGHLMGCFDI